MPRRRLWIYLLMFLLVAVNYLDRSALSVSSGPIAREFDLDPVQLGYLFSSFLWLYIICLVPMGLIVDRFGSRIVNAAGIAFWSAATVLTGFATSYAALVATRLAMGAGEATTYPGAGRVIREWVPVQERAQFFTLFNSGGYFGPALGGLVLASLASAAGWRMAFYVCGAVGFIWLAAWLIVFRLPEHANWLSATERDLILQTRADPDPPAVSGPSLGVIGLLRCPAILGMMLTQGCAVYTQYLFLSWLPNYLQSERHIALAQSGLLTALPYFGAVLLTVLFGRVSDKLLTPAAVHAGGRRHMVAAALLVAAVLLLAPFIGSTAGILLLITVALGGVATTVGLNLTLLSDLLRSPRDAGRAVSLLVVGGNVFGVVAPIVTGYVIRATGHFDAAFVVAGALLVIGALSALILTRHPIAAPATLRDARV